MKKYIAIFNINLLNNLAYPAELVWRSLGILLFMYVFTALWRATYSASGQTSLAGLTLSNTIWYLMLAETIELSRPRLARKIAQAVKDGSIAYLLSKPYDFVLYQVSSSLGETCLNLGMNTLFGSALVWMLVGPPPPPAGWLMGFAAVLGALAINILINVFIGLLAFVSEEIAPYEWIYQKLVFILGGMLIPLDFYPAWLQGIAKQLPFAYAMYAPARLFVSPDWTRFGLTLAGQLAWIVILAIGLALFYRWGMRRLSINGG
jgi:ABC-2 type transport system permease protein